MPGEELYGSGAGLIQHAGALDAQTAATNQKDAQDIRGQGATDQNAYTQEAAQRLAELKQKMGYVEVTGPMAIGFAKNTNNPSYLQWAGKQMPWDQATAMYTADLQAKHKEEMEKLKAPKISEINGPGNKLIHVKSQWDPAIDPATGKEKGWTLTPVDVGADKFDPNKNEPKPPKPATPETDDQKKRKASDMLSKIAGMKDPTAKKTLVANYNALAGKLGLEPYKEDDEGWLQKTMKFLGVGGGGEVATPTPKGATGESGLPEQATASLKQHMGSPVTFGNGQTWMMDKDGAVKKVGG